MGESGGRWRQLPVLPAPHAQQNAARRTASCATAPRCTRWNRMNESKDNGQLQNKHASSKPKESEKGILHPCFVSRDVSRTDRGKRGLDRPWQLRTPPPPLRRPRAPWIVVVITRAHDASSFRFVLSAPSFPAWLFGLPAPRQRNRKHRKYCPQDRKPTWEMSSPKRISLPPWEQRGFLQRREGSPNECTHQVRFSSVREPPTTEGRNKEELGKNCCVGCRIPVLALGTHSFDRGGIDRSIDQSRLQASDSGSIAGSREGSESLKW